MPSAVLDMSMGEVEKLIKVGVEQFNEKTKIDSIRHASLVVSVINAPRCLYKDADLIKIEDFLPKEYWPKHEQKPTSKKDRASKLSAAANAWVSQFEGLK
jgi:hypothetical protein